ncbi:MAG: hypothetical protein II820_10760 [Ruminiclostridium sp.]|nr:hypothetical protein [Ruminiclostridium sp.]
MKKRAILCASLAALIAAAGACGGSQITATSAQTTTAAETTTSAAETTTAQTTAAETTTATEQATTTIAAETSPEPNESGNAPDKLYIDDFVDERFRDKIDSFKAQNDEFMQTNRFIDYEFISGPEPSDIPADVQERAVRFTIESGSCKESEENIDTFLQDTEGNTAYTSFDGKGVESFISDGKIIPRFVAGWEDDFDGDGKTERFLAVQYPYLSYNQHAFFPTQLIFESSSGEMSIVDQVDILNEEMAVMLDYGDFKQFYLSGNGFMGVSEHTTLFGVVDGECKELYASRIWFYKQGCFLSYTGWQGISQFMIFDTETNEYREITGYPADIDKLKKCDPDDVIPMYMPDPESTSYLYYAVGGRFLIDSGSGECYRYENGKFTKCEYGSTDGLTIYPLFKTTEDDVGEWFDVDIAEALEKSGATFD